MFCSILPVFRVERMRQTTLFDVVHCIWEVNNSSFFSLSLSLSSVSTMCSFCVSVFLVRLCLKFCRWSLFTMCVVLCVFLFCVHVPVPLNFTYLIFQHKNSTPTTIEPTNMQLVHTQHITILHFAHKHWTHPICCVSKSFTLLDTTAAADDDYAVSFIVFATRNISPHSNFHSLFFFFVTVSLISGSNERHTYTTFCSQKRRQKEYSSRIYADFINFNETQAKKGVFLYATQVVCPTKECDHLFVVRIIGSISIQKGFR